MKRMIGLVAVVAVVAGLMFGLGTDTVKAQGPDWVKDTRSFPVEVTVPTADCEGGALTAVSKVEVLRSMDGGVTFDIIATIPAPVPGQVISVDQTAPHSSEAVQFEQIVYNAQGTRSCGRCLTTVGAVRVAPDCGSIRVP